MCWCSCRSTSTKTPGTFSTTSCSSSRCARRRLCHPRQMKYAPPLPVFAALPMRWAVPFRATESSRLPPGPYISSPPSSLSSLVSVVGTGTVSMPLLHRCTDAFTEYVHTNPTLRPRIEIVLFEPFFFFFFYRFSAPPGSVYNGQEIEPALTSPGHEPSNSYGSIYSSTPTH